jgi:hypothetical protein
MSTTSEVGPITQLLRRTFHDPATNKLLSTGLKIYLIFEAIHHIRSERILIPAYVVYGTSLVYTIFALFIGLFKMEESFTSCVLYKKVFGNVNFYEFQSTMAMTLALMNLSGFVFAADSYRTLFMMILTLPIVLLHLIDWYINYQSIPTSDNEPESNADCYFSQFVSHIFKKCPVFFNLIQMVCFIGAIVFLAKSKMFSTFAGYVYYCAGFSMLCLFLLTIVHIANKKAEKKCCKMHTWQKYLLIAVAVHSFLALLSFSLIYGRFTVVEEKWYFVDGIKEAPQHYYPDMISKHIGPVITTTDDPLNSTLPHYSHKVYYEKYAHAVINLPYAFALTVFTFVISFIRILPATMPSKPNTTDEIVVPDSFEQMPTDNSDKKFNNLPTVIEFLQNPNENKKHLPF